MAALHAKGVIPAQRESSVLPQRLWIPANAGMTTLGATPTMPRIQQFRSRVFFLVTMIVAMLLCAPASAQSNADYISRDLVTALLRRGGMSGQSTIRVGVPSDGLPNGIITSDMTVLGSFMAGEGDLTVAISTRSVEQTEDGIITRMPTLGFVRAAGVGQAGGETGFTSTRTTTAVATGWCRGQEVVALTVEKREEGGSRVLIARLRGAGEVCNQPAPPPRPSPLAGDTPRPQLPAPPGSTSTGSTGNSSGGSSGGARYFTTGASIRSALSLAEIVSHYAARVKESAWIARDSSVTATAGLYTFTIIDAGGIEWSGELTVSLYPGSGTATYDVRFSGRTR